jgi:hypothetical protein
MLVEEVVAGCRIDPAGFDEAEDGRVVVLAGEAGQSDQAFLLEPCQLVQHAALAQHRVGLVRSVRRTVQLQQVDAVAPQPTQAGLQ